MAGALPRAGAARALLARVAARLTTPFAYLAVLGGLQVLLACILHPLFGWWLALLLGGLWLLLLAALALLRDRWNLKLAAVSLLALVSAVAPTVTAAFLRFPVVVLRGRRRRSQQTEPRSGDSRRRRRLQEHAP